jgi:Fe-S-cluster containining protein
MMEPKEVKELRKKLQRMDKRRLDTVMHEAHDKAFECIDCLDCANCCKTTSPAFTDKDITRIAKHLRMKAIEFTDTYLRIDEDDDWVLQTAPCPFLAGDNYCMIYEVRPKACREYPHTDRVKQFQLIELTLRNEKICPAVEQMLSDVSKNT